MFDYINPITYTTDINTLAFGYNTGATFGFNPYTTGNFFDGSIFSPQNLFRDFSNFNIYKQNPFNTNSNFNTTSNLYYQPLFSSPLNQAPGAFIYPIPDFNIYKLANQMNSPQETSTTNTVTKTTPSKQSENVTVNKNKKTTNSSKTIGEAFVKNAQKYLGYNEADGSSKKFSNSGEWCADFVSYVVKETYKSQGKTPPKDFGNHRVEILKQWGIKNDKYLQVANKSNRAKLIAEKVKPGDIMILRENNASHTGFVTKVYPNGVFETIEGNRYDKVTRFKYSPNYSDISGFVQLRE